MTKPILDALPFDLGSHVWLAGSCAPEFNSPFEIHTARWRHTWSVSRMPLEIGGVKSVPGTLPHRPGWWDCFLLNNPMNKPFALLICHSLRVATFEHEEDLQTAIATLRLKDRLYVPLRWNADAATYVPQEVLE